MLLVVGDKPRSSIPSRRADQQVERALQMLRRIGAGIDEANAPGRAKGDDRIGIGKGIQKGSGDPSPVVRVNAEPDTARARVRHDTQSVHAAWGCVQIDDRFVGQLQRLHTRLDRLTKDLKWNAVAGGRRRGRKSPRSVRGPQVAGYRC